MIFLSFREYMKSTDYNSLKAGSSKESAYQFWEKEFSVSESLSILYEKFLS